MALQAEVAPLSAAPRGAARKTAGETETGTGGTAIATAIIVIGIIVIGIEIGIVTAIEAAPLLLLSRVAPRCPPARCLSL